MNPFRPIKSKSTPIGMKKNPETTETRGFMRKVSNNQRIRTKHLQEKLKVILAVQERLYGQIWCEAGARQWRDKCPREKGRSFKLVADHVNNRQEGDFFSNLQVLCGWCNFQKGSQRIDFRPPEMVEEMKKLDKEAEHVDANAG